MSIEALRRAAIQFKSGPERSALTTQLRNWLQTAEGRAFLSQDNDRVDLLKQVLAQLDAPVGPTPAAG